MRNRLCSNWRLPALLLAANLSLLLPNAHPLRVLGALLLVGLLPGWGWSRLLLADHSPLLRWTTAAALSFIITGLVALLLHYLPGPILLWPLLLLLNVTALLPCLFALKPNAPGNLSWRDALPLLLILLVSLVLRTANLSYSEFQGDEALAMIAAAESIEAHEDALFLRSKGPGEVLLPLAMWRLTGVITEPIARLPFTVAAMGAIVTLFLIGQRVGGLRVGWLATGFFAFNGFMVAFGRIVQYQALVVWFSALAFLLLLEWQTVGRLKLALLGGLSLGAGLLAHYDAVLVLPAIGWLLVRSQEPEANSSPPLAVSNQEPTAGPTGQPDHIDNSQFKTPASPARYVKASRRTGVAVRHSLPAMLLFAAGMLLVALPFYLPFALDPQANRTGDYLGSRIGRELRNNLPDFFHFTTFYSSSVYLIVTGLLVLFFLAFLLWRAGFWGRLAAGVAVIGMAAVVLAPGWFWPDSDLNLSLLPFALLLGGAFVVLFSASAPPAWAGPWQAVIGWLAVPFLGYNFLVTLGLTHIYTTVPAWALLAALGWQQLAGSRFPSRAFKNKVWLPSLLAMLFFGLSTLFLWNAFVRHDVEYWQDYPNGNLALFWTPYAKLPQTGFFGFSHRTGWKAVGQQIAAGKLSGDYSSNEEPDVTTWYTRGAPRACDAQPEYFFLADDLIDPVTMPAETLNAAYREIGRVVLSNQKSMRILQQMPPGAALGPLDEAKLSRQFDRGATPAAFARSGRGSRPVEANFGQQVKLVGFDLDTRRVFPGGRLPVTLYWQALAPLEASYQVFTHLEAKNGPVAQADGVPVCWTYPTDAWRPGQIIADQHAIALPPDIKPGTYPLEVGLYLPDTLDRLDLLDEAGNPAGTSLTLAQIEIMPEKQP